MKRNLKNLTKLVVILFATTIVGLGLSYKTNHNLGLSKTTSAHVIKTNFHHDQPVATGNDYAQIANSTSKNLVKNLINQKLTNKVDTTLAAIQTVFKTKLNNSINSLPKNETEAQNKAITYLVQKITEKTNNNLWYQRLSDYLKKILLNNFINEKLYHYLNKNEQYLPHKKYLDNYSSIGNNLPYVYNTLTFQEIEEAVDKVLSTWKNYLIDQSNNNQNNNDNFGFSWYSNIPNSLKPTIYYNQSFDQQDYFNIIDAIVTNRENSEIITQHGGLIAEQNAVDEKLKTKLEADKKFLLEKTTNHKNELFIDQAPINLAKIFQDLSQVDLDFTKLWNLHFSNWNDIKLNKQIFEGHDIRVQVRSLFKIVNPFSSVDQPRIEWKLSLNNAIVLGQTDFGYNLNINDSAHQILNLIYQTIEKQGANLFIKFNPKSVNKFDLNFNGYDFILNQRLVQYLSIRNINLKINQNVERYFTNKTNINQYQLDLNGSIKSYNKLDQVLNKNLVYTINPDLERQLLESAPLLPPIFDNNENKNIENKLPWGFTDQLGEIKKFSYHNSNPIFNYRTILFHIYNENQNDTNRKIRVVTRITLKDQFATNKFKDYTTIVPFYALNNLNQFA
ncbi:hypothetical protein MCAV_01940 [[Mycoplasma] cavipharyngis]|uniref:hypothetical protein n=1 Tax=[Mycoplasma] cavipharyngis TaxID=92757 RepID=UPI0037047B0A